MSVLSTICRWFNRQPVSRRIDRNFRPTVEGMEERVVPANVTASVANGVLTLDSAIGAFNDDIKIVPSSILGRFDIVGLNGTTINGMTTFTCKGFSSIVLNMKGGDDHVVFGATLPGSLTFNGGNGNNELELDTWSTIGKGLVYTGAAGSDTLSVFGFHITIGGNIQANMGAGENTTYLAGAVVGGNVLVTGLEGIDTVSTDNLIVTGNLTANLGDGANYVGIESMNDNISGGELTVIVGDLTITTGKHADTIEIGSENSAHISGVVVINTGDELAGGDTVLLDNSSFDSSVTINLGAGNDSVFFDTVDNLNTSLDFGGALTVYGAGGNDNFVFGQDSGARFADLESPPTLDGGAGTDTLFLIDLYVDDVHVDTIAKLGKNPTKFENIVVL